LVPGFVPAGLVAGVVDALVVEGVVPVGALGVDVVPAGVVELAVPLPLAGAAPEAGVEVGAAVGGNDVNGVGSGGNGLVVMLAINSVIPASELL